MLRILLTIFLILLASCQFKSSQSPGDLVAGHVSVVEQFTVSVPTDGTRNIGDVLTFTLRHPYAVTVTGTPRLTLTIGASTVYANYVSGSGTTTLTFSYTVISGNNDTDGISVASSVDLNGGTLSYVGTNGPGSCTLTLTVPSTSGIIVITTPSITSFLVVNGTYYPGQTFTVTAVFSEAVNVTGIPRIPITLDAGGPIYATYTSGTGTTNIVFTATVAIGNDDATGVVITTPLQANGGTIRNAILDDANVNFTQPSTPSLLVSGVAPTVTSVTAPADGLYSTAENLDFVVNFSETVNAGNTAFVNLNLDIGGSSVQASYLSGSGSSALTFRYTITGGDVDIDGMAITTLALTVTGYITDGDATANAAVLTFTPPDTSAILVNAPVPNISSVTSPADATYLNAQTIDFIVNYSIAVNVTGTPRLTLTVGATTTYATYLSGSGGTALTFRYTIADPEVDTDGIACSTSMDNNGGTIKSLVGVNATTPVPAQTLTGVLVDGDVPDVISITPPANAVYDTSDVSFNFSVTFDQVVTVAAGTPRIVLDLGGTARYANYVSGTGTATLLFTHTINSGDIDLNGISFGNSGDLDLNGATIKDANTNNANLALSSVDLSRVIVSYPNMVGWIDPDDASTVTTTTCGADSCASYITDKTANGFDLTALIGNRPVYLASGFGTGNTAYLQFNNSTALMNFATPMTNMRTVLIVFENEPVQSATCDLFYSSLSGTNGRIEIKAGTGYDLSYGSGNSAGFSLNGSPVSADATSGDTNFVAGSKHVMVVRFAINQSPANVQRIGDIDFGGKIAEFMVFTSTALTDVELAPIINYLNTKHGVY